MSRFPVCLFALVVGVAALPAAAAEPTAAQPPIESDAKRLQPDYDGRGDELTAGEVLIWIPRGLFYPIYLFTEYGLRWPLRQFVSWYDSTPSTAPFWTFGPGNKSGVVPSAVFDFGFRPSIGLYFYSDDAIVEHLGFRTHFAFGGPDWYRTTATVRYILQEGSRTKSERLLQGKFIFSHRPDWIFYGLGPDSDAGDHSRYQAQVFEGTLKYDGGFWRSSRLISWFGVRHTTFEDESCCGDLSIGEAVEARLIPERPPLYDQGYTVGRSGFDLSLDSRPVRFIEASEGSDWEQPSGTGVKIASHVELSRGLHVTTLPDGTPTRLGYAHYGGTLGGFVDVFNQRIIGLELFADFTDPLIDGEPIPFTELVSLGGSRPMRGFLERRLVDRSAMAATLSYSYPIWVWLDGSAHYAVGNVFGEHFAEFDPSLLRQSFGFGFRSVTARDHTLELLVAFGTDTFDRRAGLDTFRLVIGSSEDFPLETK